MDGVISWTGICAWDSDWKRAALFPVLLDCLGLGLRSQCTGVRISLWGKVSCVLLFLRDKKEAQRYPSYPCQVSNSGVINYLYSKWRDEVSLRDYLEPWVRWLHAGGIYPAQRPVLGCGASWGCSKSNANFGCYQPSASMVQYFIFFSAELSVSSVLFHKATEAHPAKTISH